MKNTSGLAVVAVAGLAIWAFATGKIKMPGAAASTTTPAKTSTTPAIVTPQTTKQPATNQASPWATVPQQIALSPTFVNYGGGYISAGCR